MLALTDIALHSENGSSVSAPDIAERQGISQKYLEQILTHLKQAGLIRAQKGLRGGYALTRPAGKIRLSEILNALDNSILEETGAGSGETLRDAVNACLWQKMNRTMIDFAESKTLAEFLTDCRQQLTGEWDLYEI
jgi:Rrf2 family protein